MIAVLFGGRIAEEMFMDQMTTGASNDFERATEIARRMVTQWGMSDELGPMVYGENEGEVFLGRSITTHKNVSEATMQKVDAEIRAHHRPAVRASRARSSRRTATRSRSWPRRCSSRETLDADQIDDIMSGKPPRPPKPTQRRRRRRRRQRRRAAERRHGEARVEPPGTAPRGVKLISAWSSSAVATLDSGRWSWAWSTSRPIPFPTAAVPRSAQRAIAHARRLVEEGADILDIGGESTRPGAAPVSADEELERVLPVSRRSPTRRAVSVDTASRR